MISSCPSCSFDRRSAISSDSLVSLDFSQYNAGLDKTTTKRTDYPRAFQQYVDQNKFINIEFEMAKNYIVHLGLKFR
jgi:hypothetical protein